MRPTFQWDEPIELEAGRTCDYVFSLYQPSGKPAAIPANSAARFKLCATADDATPLLDIDSVAPLTGKSVVTINSQGVQDVSPARVTVRFAQDDTKDFEPGAEYFGELGVVDASETDPLNAFKRAGYGPVTIKPSPGGDVGLT